jgi:hypothetical protein
MREMELIILEIIQAIKLKASELEELDFNSKYFYKEYEQGKIAGYINALEEIEFCIKSNNNLFKENEYIIDSYSLTNLKPKNLPSNDEFIVFPPKFN